MKKRFQLLFWAEHGLLQHIGHAWSRVQSELILD